MRAALLALVLTSQAPRASLPFLHEDWPAAVAQAKASGRPILVEAWAPW